MLESWKHCVARGWTEAAAAKAEAKKKKRGQLVPWKMHQNKTKNPLNPKYETRYSVKPETWTNLPYFNKAIKVGNRTLF